MRQRVISLDSNDNTLFCTEQCNNHCIMCCQPPQNNDDIDMLFNENIQRIKTAPKYLDVIGITGGEPTLLGNKLIELINLIRRELPNTDIHLLSNGRAFSNYEFAKAIVQSGEGHIVFGIPLHSDYYADHDIIAGSKGAFNETIVGLYNLASLEALIELRIVMNKLNYTRFLPIAEFIHKNLPFATFVAYMGMEYVGHAVSKSSKIWIEPIEYIDNLQNAIKYLSELNYDVSIYNIPLCLLPTDLYDYARRSISDWKNKFIECCDQCILKTKCCGMFSTSKDIYKGIKSIKHEQV